MHTEHEQEDVHLVKFAQLRLRGNPASVSCKCPSLEHSTWLVNSFQLGRCGPFSHQPRIEYQSIFACQRESHGKKDVAGGLDVLDSLESSERNGDHLMYDLLPLLICGVTWQKPKERESQIR